MTPIEIIQNEMLALTNGATLTKEYIIKHFLADEKFVPLDLLLTAVERILKKIREKEVVQENKDDKPYLIKKGEKYFVGEHRFSTINEGNQQNYTDNLDIVAPTMDNYYEQLRARRLQREYELWCMKYPCDWSDKSKCKYYAYYDNRAKKCKIECAYEEQQANVLYCSNWLNIDDYINIVGEEDFKKYVLEIGLKKYWLEV